MRSTHARWRLLAATLATSLLFAAGPAFQAVGAGQPAAGSTAVAAPAAGPNLATGKTVTASSHTQSYAPAAVNDGNQGTYWESNNNAFPQWAQVDLGSAVSTNQVVLKLPTGWGARNQTLAIQGSTDGTTFTDLSAAAVRSFAPASDNTVTIDYGNATVRYVRVRITANTGWPAGQLSEVEVYGPATGDNLAPDRAGQPGLHRTRRRAGQARPGRPRPTTSA